MKTCMAILLFVVISFPYLTTADVPGLISYQGILKDSEGQPVEDDVYAIKFRIYNAETQGSVLWESEGFIPIQTTNGLFQHVLGSTDAIPDSLSRYSNLWVGITVDLDEELSPRTKLVSVPFSINAQYSDTTGTSLDKTIDASELTEGTLDVERFSAYGDLVTEEKIGEASDQVAAGDHLHSFSSLPGMIHRDENTSLQEIVINPPFSTMLLKTLTIPSDKINDFFRITFPVYFSGNDGNYLISVRLDDISVVEYMYSIYTPGQYRAAYSINCMRARTTEWIFWEIDGNNKTWANIDPNDGLLVEVFLTHAGGMSSPLTITIGNLIVEYDVD